MTEESIFPQLRGKTLPCILTKILLHVNYHADDHLCNLRLVSRGWNDFIKTELLVKPSMKKVLTRKDFVDAWLNRRPTKRTLLEDPRTFSNLKSPKPSTDIVFSYVHHDCVFVRYEKIGRVAIYKDFAFLGYVESSQRLVPCGDHFLNRDYYRCGVPLAKLRAYGRTQADTLELPEFDLWPTLDLSGLKTLGLEMVNAETVLLVCKGEKSSIVLINLVDGFKKTIAVSQLGQGVDVSIAVDSRELVIYWQQEGSLQLIDLAQGKEVWWTRENMSAPRKGWMQIIDAKTTVYTCTMTFNVTVARNQSTMHFYDNKNGSLLNCFSAAHIFGNSNFVARKGSFLWAGWRSPSYITHVNVVERRILTRLDLQSTFQAACWVCSASSSSLYVWDVVVVRDRLVLVCSKCNCKDDNGWGARWVLVACDQSVDQVAVLVRGGYGDKYVCDAERRKVWMMPYQSLPVLMEFE